MSKTYEITGKTIEGNFQGVPRTSCAKIDYVTRERISIEVDGIAYDRAIYERAIYRAMAENTILARFVIVNGVQYEIAEREAAEALELVKVEDAD